MHAKSLQLCLTPCNPMDCSRPGSSALFQRISLTQGSNSCFISPAFACRFFTSSAIREELCTALEAGNSKVRASADLLSSGNPLPGSQMGSSCCVLMWHKAQPYVVLKGALTPFHFPSSSVGKESACNAGDLGLIPGSGRSPGEENGSPLQHSCLENSTDRGHARLPICRSGSNS